MVADIAVVGIVADSNAEKERNTDLDAHIGHYPILYLGRLHILDDTKFVVGDSNIDEVLADNAAEQKLHQLLKVTKQKH